MPGQSVNFDFTSTGVDNLARGAVKVGGSMELAAKGAKALKEALDRQQGAAPRTAAEMTALGRAVRLFGDAEDKATLKTLAADAAIRNLGDAADKTTRKMSALDRAGKSAGDSFTAMGKAGPGWLAPLVAAIPALATIGGVGVGAGIGLAGAFTAGAGALAAFGAVAKPVLGDAMKAAQAVSKAQDAYNTAIASGTPKAKAYAAEQKAITAAYADMSPQQVALSKQLGAMGDAWDAVKAKETPVIAGALQPWLKAVTGLTKQLGPIIARVAPVIGDLGSQFEALVSSRAFTAFRNFIASTGSAAVLAGGNLVIDFFQAAVTILPKFNPLIKEAVGWVGNLGPKLLTWASSQKTADHITAFMAWFNTNGPAVGGLLKSIGGALAALAPGLTAGGALEIKVITDFLNFVAKLPPGVVKPLAEVAGAALLLSKIPGGGKVISYVISGSLGGIFGGKGGGAAVGEAAAGGAAASGLWSKILPGARLVGGALVISLVIDQLLQNPKNPRVLGNTNPNSPWNSFTSNESLGGKAINAIVALFHHATVSVQADFAAQGKAATAATGDVDTLTAAITHNGNASGEAHAARAALLADMEKAGVNASVAQADVMNYSNAVQANGAKSRQAQAAREKLTADILAASTNAAQGRADMNNYTTAVQQHGVKSDQARGARQRLITDLENAGADAKTATGLVDGLGSAVRRLPSGKTLTLQMIAEGQGGVKVFSQGLAAKEIMLSKLAAGGMVRMGSGPTADDVPAMLSHGEFVHKSKAVSKYGVPAMEAVNAGKAVIGFAGRRVRHPGTAGRRHPRRRVRRGRRGHAGRPVRRPGRRPESDESPDPERAGHDRADHRELRPQLPRPDPLRVRRRLADQRNRLLRVHPGYLRRVRYSRAAHVRGAVRVGHQVRPGARRPGVLRVPGRRAAARACGDRAERQLGDLPGRRDGPDDREPAFPAADGHRRPQGRLPVQYGRRRQPGHPCGGRHRDVSADRPDAAAAARLDPAVAVVQRAGKPGGRVAAGPPRTRRPRRTGWPSSTCPPAGTWPRTRPCTTSTAGTRTPGWGSSPP